MDTEKIYCIVICFSDYDIECSNVNRSMYSYKRNWFQCTLNRLLYCYLLSWLWYWVFKCLSIDVGIQIGILLVSVDTEKGIVLLFAFQDIIGRCVFPETEVAPTDKLGKIRLHKTFMGKSRLSRWRNRKRWVLYGSLSSGSVITSCFINAAILFVIS